MYTNEIKQYFEQRNYIIDDYNEFYKIFLDSPQISIIKLEEICEDRCRYHVLSDDFAFDFWLKNKKE